MLNYLYVMLGGAIGTGTRFWLSGGDRFVNAADATVTRNGSGQTASATNFRADVNVDGTINAADATTVRNNSGSGLPQADRAIEKAKVAREQ